MDKYEYRVKLEEISNLVDNQDYEEAMKVVDSIDWRRVKSARTLCMVGEIYEANQRYVESREILLLAYERAPIGKTVLYRLVELAIKMGAFEDAVEYYNEFVENSPNDNTKYILKYKIYRARRAPIQDQIAILEEYKGREYTERWAYELARLYAKAGMQDKCIEECDDLILWFSEGKFVSKAMELKMGYVPLTADQREKYQHRYVEKPKPVIVPKPKSVSVPKPVQEVEKEKSQLEETQAAENPTEEPEKESVFAPILETTGVIQEKIAKGIRDVFSGKAREEKEENEEHITEQIEELEKETQETKMRETKGVGESIPKPEMIYPVLEKPSTYVVKDLEPEILESVASASALGLASAIKTANRANEEDLRAQITEAKPFELPPLEALKIKEAKERAEKRSAYQPNILKVKDLEEEIIAEPVGETLKTTGDTEEIDIDAILAEATSSLAKQISSGNIEPNIEEPIEVEKELVKEIEPEEKIIDSIKEIEPEEKTTESIKEIEPEEKITDSDTKLWGNTEEFNFSPPEESDEDLGITKNLNLQEELLRALQEEPTQEEPTQEEPTQEEAPEAIPEAIKELIQETSQEPINEEKTVLVRHHLDAEEQKRILTYFEPIPGVKEQVNEVLDKVQESACDKTSQKGNIIVMGRAGTGKTRLSEGIIKAICMERRMPAAKVAYLDAAKMQQKDPASVVAKLAGGFLIIEKAGALTSETVEELSKAMNFRTDGLTVILEDEKQLILELLKREETFAEKFEARITIPVFTNDELVSFARTYAKEMGYKMDEMGVLALYTIIGDNQKEDEPISVAKVKDMVDKAIKKAGKGTRRLGRKFSKKHVDEDNRIILYEKDFEY